MKKLFIIILFLFLPQIGLGQIKYSGTIADKPVDIYVDDIGYSVYTYLDSIEPIPLRSDQTGDYLYLYRIDERKDTTETFIFPDYNASARKISGRMLTYSSDNSLPINLKKTFEIEYGENIEWKSREVLQRESLPNYYFKTINTKEKGRFYSYVSGVKIFKKQTGQMIQKIENLRFNDRFTWGLSTGDFNFDGYQDFALFERSYIGPNTSKCYYLYNPETGQFFDSGFEGTSLEFSQDKKRIYERNSSQAGNTIYAAVYKVVDNKMVVVEEHCIKWDPDKKERTERPIEECK